jgi:hypothetical protein
MQPSPSLETAGPLAPSVVVISAWCFLSFPISPDPPHEVECNPSILEGVARERSKPRAMTEHEASRTLVKSPPELWAECSDAASLARHLGQFGEIRITRLEPETAVAWEGEHASGTVRLEPSGWGTRVILTARRLAGEVPAVEAGPAVDAGPAVEVGPAVEAGSADQVGGSAQDGGAVDPVPPAPRPRAFGRLLGLLRRAPKAPGVQPAGVKRPVVEPPGSEPAVAPGAIDSQAALDCALDSLGQAHHRPFSRA